MEIGYGAASDNHKHCFHAYRGVIWMVIPDGHILEKCCNCEITRLVHVDHARDHAPHKELPPRTS